MISPDDEFLQKVVLLANEYLSNYNAKILGVAELSPGVVCVKDDYLRGEADLYFDLSRWAVRYEMRWPYAAVPLTTESSGVGYIGGAGSTYGSGKGGSIREFEEALPFAKRNLIVLVESHAWWHDAPKIIE